LALRALKKTCYYLFLIIFICAFICVFYICLKIAKIFCRILLKISIFPTLTKKNYQSIKLYTKYKIAVVAFLYSINNLLKNKSHLFYIF